MTGTTASVSIPDARIYGQSGPDIVLLHGVGLQRASWDLQLPCLEQLGRVHALDLPGHGQSPMLASENPGLIDFVLSVEAYLCRNTRGPLVLIGHSLGALIAIRLAARNPVLCGALVALTPVFDRSDTSTLAVQSRADRLLQADERERLEEPVERWFGRAPEGDNRRFAQACRLWLSQVDLFAYQRAYQVFASTRGPGREDLAAIDCPSLFITGANDRNSTPAMSKTMAGLVRGGRHRIVEDAAHMLQLTHAHALNSTLNEFLSELATLSRVERAG